MKSQEPKEEKLLDELESMYQRVAESEKSEPDPEQVETLQSYYETLRLSPDASLETISKTYKRMVDVLDPAQFANNPPLREEAERKLAEITRAYEKILASRQREGEPPSAQPPIQISQEPAPSAPNEETGHHLPWGKILVGATAFVVIILAIFFWPTLYYYDTVPSGDKTYQVRTNRITGSITYFDEGKWNEPPLPAAKPSQPPRPPDVAPPAQPPAISVKQPMPAPAITPGPAEGLKVAGEKEPPSEKPASQPAETKGYAIQVGAMRDLTMAKEFVETQKKSGQPVYLVKIKGKDREVWYRIYIGRFADKAEAARYIKEKKIKEIFPECFIRKLSG